LSSGNGNLILCSPGEEVLSGVAPLIQDMLTYEATQIPDSQVITRRWERIPPVLARWVVG